MTFDNKVITSFVVMFFGFLLIQIFYLKSQIFAIDFFNLKCYNRINYLYQGVFLWQQIIINYGNCLLTKE